MNLQSKTLIDKWVKFPNRNLKKLKLERIVYVSCNPSTLVRDLKELSKIYMIKEIQPFDNFCYTSHVETVAVLVKK